MHHPTRRTFLKSAGATAALAFTGPFATAQDYGGFEMGAQSYSFRNFGFPECIDQLKALGLTKMEFFSGHFPPDASHENFDSVKKTLQEAGITAKAFGVEAFTADAAANRKKFEFAKALGVDILTADPTPDSFDNLDELCEEFGIIIAIHNHGPGARYDKVEDTLEAVEGHHKLIGACLDTGHAIRSGEKPHETARALGDRLHSLHLKDWIHGEEEQIVGDGDLDLVELVNALNAVNFDGFIALEYELSPENPAPDMLVGLNNWQQATEKANA